MPNWPKPDSTKVTPSKKGDVSIKHNLYDLIGDNLYRALQGGRLTGEQLRRDLEHKASIKAKLGLGKGYGAEFGYNVPSGRGKVDKFNIKLKNPLKNY